MAALLHNAVLFLDTLHAPWYAKLFLGLVGFIVGGCLTIIAIAIPCLLLYWFACFAWTLTKKVLWKLFMLPATLMEKMAKWGERSITPRLKGRGKAKKAVPFTHVDKLNAEYSNYGELFAFGMGEAYRCLAGILAAFPDWENGISAGTAMVVLGPAAFDVLHDQYNLEKKLLTEAGLWSEDEKESTHYYQWQAARLSLILNDAIKDGALAASHKAFPRRVEDIPMRGPSHER